MYELILFLLDQITLKINNYQNNSEDTNKLISLILNHICEAYEGEFIPEILDNIYQIYLKDYDKFNFEISNNIIESLCSLSIIEQSENVFLLSIDEIIIHLKKNYRSSYYNNNKNRQNNFLIKIKELMAIKKKKKKYKIRNN